MIRKILQTDSQSALIRTVVLTGTAMIAFAANALLCRMALGQGLIDAASFTSLRILAGAAALGVIISVRGQRTNLKPSWISIAALFCFMAFFSFAYLTLTAGTGALLLSGTVQLMMFTTAIVSGERFSWYSWIGIALALAGLVYLVAPGVSAPDPIGAVFMVITGVAWGVYSLIGRSSTAPLIATTANFVYCIPLTILLSLFFITSANLSLPGVILALASGALASGLGYAVWYSALPSLTAGQGGTVQLSVPLIAAIGGVLFLSEQISFRLIIASCLTITGIWLALKQRSQPSSIPKKV